jgi:hypothetical protein
MKSTVPILMVVIMILLLRCSMNMSVAGAGSETTNSFSGIALNNYGSPIAGAIIHVRPAQYLADTTGPAGLTKTSFDTIANDSGYFAFTLTVPGAYVVEVNDGQSTAVMRACTVSTGRTSENLGSQVLLPYATITGTLSITSLPANAVVSITIFGLDRIVHTDSLGVFSFTDLPAGTYSLKIDLSSGSFTSSIVSDITIQAGDTVNIGTINISR